MFVALLVLSVLLALTLLVSAGGKIARQESQLATLRHVGFPTERAWLLAAAEIAGAVGLVIGLSWPPLGIAAGIGIILYFLGAVISHLRVREWHIAPAAVLMVVAAGTLVLHTITPQQA